MPDFDSTGVSSIEQDDVCRTCGAKLPPQNKKGQRRFYCNRECLLAVKEKTKIAFLKPPSEIFEDCNNGKIINLFGGYSSIVDESDYEYLLKFKWHIMMSQEKIFASRIHGSGKAQTTKYMHKDLIENGYEKGVVVSHANGNGLDNRRRNLEIRSTIKSQTCVNCSSVFDAKINKGKWATFCSEKCRLDYSKKNGKTFVNGNCAHCMKFGILASNRLFCNFNCKKLFMISNEIYNKKTNCYNCKNDLDLYEFPCKIGDVGLLVFGKRCTKCQTKSSMSSVSKESIKSFRMMSKYGINIDEYRKLADYQEYKCYICNDQFDREDPNIYYKLCIDHDHDTMIVRNLLCRKCNSALGGFKDDPEIILKAYNYLISHGKIVGINEE